MSNVGVKHSTNLEHREPQRFHLGKVNKLNYQPNSTRICVQYGAFGTYCSLHSHWTWTVRSPQTQNPFFSSFANKCLVG